MQNILRFHQGLSRFDARLTDWGGSLLSLALRLFVGWQFFKAGLTKIGDWSATLALFRDEYQVPILPPEIAALMGTAGELALPILLFAGLLSRPAALGLFAFNHSAPEKSRWITGFPGKTGCDRFSRTGSIKMIAARIRNVDAVRRVLSSCVR